ncbi:hypothetical protein FB446DRAFT_783272 [Lentinula raphanica]|nr:hypothetical protein FB446DRAFT_783272 [Lentinula raphanica]
MQYNTVIECGNLRTDSTYPAIQAIIKIYSPPQERSTPPLPNRAAAFVVGQFALGAAGQPAMIDAFTLIPIPGHPGTPEYEVSLPWFFPFLSGVGCVLDNSAAGIQPRSFLLSVSEYVRGSSKSFSLRGVYDGDNGRGRWANTPLPTLGSNMFFHGSCLGFNNGALDINIHSLNFATTLTPTAIDPASSGSVPTVAGGNQPPTLPLPSTAPAASVSGPQPPPSHPGNTNGSVYDNNVPTIMPSRKRVRHTYADVSVLPNAGFASAQSASTSSPFTGLPSMSSIGPYGSPFMSQPVYSSSTSPGPSASPPFTVTRPADVQALLPDGNGSQSSSPAHPSPVQSDRVPFNAFNGQSVSPNPVESGVASGTTARDICDGCEMVPVSNSQPVSRPGSPSPNNLIMSPPTPLANTTPSSSPLSVPGSKRGGTSRRKKFGIAIDVPSDLLLTIEPSVIEKLNNYRFIQSSAITADIVDDVCRALGRPSLSFPPMADDNPWTDSGLLTSIAIYQQRRNDISEYHALPDSTSLVVSFAIPATPDHACNALVVFLTHHNSLLYEDTNRCARLLSFAFQHTDDFGVIGFVAYEGVSSEYFQRFLDTPWFDIYDGEPNTVFYVEPANHPRLSSSSFIQNIIAHARSFSPMSSGVSRLTDNLRRLLAKF